jgi:glycosyltransferase involved in cell wall biosynthesis
MLGKAVAARRVLQGYGGVFIHALHPAVCLPLMIGPRPQPVYVFQHGLTLGATGFKQRLKRYWYNTFIRMTQCGVIASTEFAVAKSKAMGISVSDARTHVIPFGVDFSKYEQPPPVVQSRTDVRIGMAGRLVEQKRFDRVLRALQGYAGKIPLRLAIAGQGPEKARLERMCADLPGTVEVSFLGNVEDMKSLYHGLDLFILPSVGESFGLVVLEALLCGVPVAVFDDVGGCLGLVRDGETGFVLKGDQALADLFERLGRRPDVLGTMAGNIKREEYASYDIAKTRNLLNSLNP